MSLEHKNQPSQPRPYEAFGFTEEECLSWRVSDERFKEILNQDRTNIHTIKLSSNSYGEFLFVTTSRGSEAERVFMTFWGLGFHEYRERWLTQEWFWHQTSSNFIDLQVKFTTGEAQEQLAQRFDEIFSSLHHDVQTELGRMFEELADMTDDDAALAEMQDLGLL